jgi:hypothetical protein
MFLFGLTHNSVDTAAAPASPQDVGGGVEADPLERYARREGAADGKVHSAAPNGRQELCRLCLKDPVGQRSHHTAASWVKATFEVNKEEFSAKFFVGADGSYAE